MIVNIMIMILQHNSMTNDLEKIIQCCGDEIYCRKNEILALQEEINSLDWQKFRIISSLSCYLIQKDIYNFDKKTRQLRN